MIEFLAQGVQNTGLPPETTILGQTIIGGLISILGTVLGWFMWRNEKKNDQVIQSFKEMADAMRGSISDHSSTIDRLSAAMLAQTLVHPNLPDAAKPALNQMMEDIKEADVRRRT
jgi:hypothetical protein